MQNLKLRLCQCASDCHCEVLSEVPREREVQKREDEEAVGTLRLVPGAPSGPNRAMLLRCAVRSKSHTPESLAM